MNTNFSDLIAGLSDGTKDLNISALTAAGTATFNGSVLLGNASGDDIQFNGSLATSIPIKTTNTYDIGSTSLGLAGIYISIGASKTVRMIGASGGASSYSITWPNAVPGASGWVASFSNAGVITFVSPGSVNVDNAAGTSGVTLTSTSEVIKKFTNSAAITVKLDNSFSAGRKQTIINAGTAEITLTANDNSTIATIYRGTTYTCYCTTASPSTNTSWDGLTPIISPSLDWSSVITTSALGTTTNNKIFMQRVGKYMLVQGRVDTGTTAGSTFSINLPTVTPALTIDYTNAHGTLAVKIGSIYRIPDTTPAIGAQETALFLDGSTTNKVFMSGTLSNNTMTKENGNGVFTSGDSCTFEFRIAITEWDTYKG